MSALSSNLEAPAAGVATVATLLQQLGATQSVGCLSIQVASVEWEIALQQGNRVFATYSLEPIEKLDRQLHRLSFQNRLLTTDVREQVKKKLADSLKTLSRVEAECSAIGWLIDQHYIPAAEAEQLTSRLTIEALESCFDLSEFRHNFLKVDLADIGLSWPTLASALEHCTEQADLWRALGPHILSPYQRPYLSEAGAKLSAEQQESFRHLLVGFSFRQLSGLLNQDEVRIAQYLQPLVQAGTVQLLGPQSPYDQLPLLPSSLTLPVDPSSTKTSKDRDDPPSEPIRKTLDSAQKQSSPWSLMQAIRRPQRFAWTTLLMATVVSASLILLISHWLANSSSEQHQSEQLLQEYQTLIKQNPSDFYALVMLNNLYISQGQYSRALPVVQRIIELKPDNLEWQLALARVYDLAGQEKSAEQAYDRILAKDERHFEALLGKARLLQSQGSMETAKRFYQRAEQAAPSASLKANVQAEIRRLVKQ